MPDIGFLQEYEDMLLGKRKTFSAEYAKEKIDNKVIGEVIRYVYVEMLGWNAEMAYEYTTPDLLKQLRLTRIINKLDYPTELDVEQDFYFISSVAFPKTIKIKKKDIIIEIYKKVLSGESAKFPKDFFLRKDAQRNLSLCLIYAINQYLHVEALENLYSKFSDVVWASDFLKDIRLFDAYNRIYYYPVDFLHQALPPVQRDELHYVFYRFRSSLTDVLRKGGRHARDNK